MTPEPAPPPRVPGDSVPVTAQRARVAAPLRPMRWWDIPAVAALDEVLFPGETPWTEAMFWGELAAGNRYVVAVDGDPCLAMPGRPTPGRDPAADGSGVILGYAGLAVGPDDADVQTIGVAPAAQRRGVGRALFAELLRLAGERAVHLEVRTDNAAAIALYESEGFTRIGIRRRYYRPSGADAFTMIRPARCRSGIAVAATGGRRRRGVIRDSAR